MLRRKKILVDAVAVDNATACAILTDSRIKEAYFYPNNAWFTAFIGGRHPAGLPALVPHPESPLNGLHPYVFMITVLYIAWGILMVRGAKDPKANAALFDWGILANLLHGLLMIPQALIYPNEHAHLWADVPLLFAVSAVCWIWPPNRIAPEAPKT